MVFIEEGIQAAHRPRFSTGLLFAVVAAVFFAFTARAAQAGGTLFLSPSSGTYRVGQTFSVSIFVSSPDQAMNAVSGDVVFPSDKLAVSSVSKGGSIISLWVAEPSASAASVHFEGVVMNPGYQGKSGRIFTINFRAKSVGDATVSFRGAQLLANDGSGTSILSGAGRGTYHFDTAAAPKPPPPPPPPPKPVTPPPPPPPPTPAPAAPFISSPSYPYQNKWYASRAGSFQWTLPKDVIGVSYWVDHAAETVPDTVSEGILSYVPYQADSDGIWYFHARVSNAGGWSPTATYRFQIDTGKPAAFEIKPLPRSDATAPTTAFLFDATDTVSGIDHYDVRMDDGQPTAWTDDGAHTFQTPPFQPGKHYVSANAVDRAGNYLTASAEWQIEMIAAPRITEFLPTMPTGEWMVVKGTAHPDALVIVTRVPEGGQPIEETVAVDRNGHWVFVSEEKVPAGTYAVWAVAQDARGAKSPPTERITIRVLLPFAWLFRSFLTNPALMGILLLILLVLIFFLFFYHRHSCRHLERKMRKEIQDLQQSVEAGMTTVKQDLSRTDAQRAVQDMAQVENVFEKKIDQIERGL